MEVEYLARIIRRFKMLTILASLISVYANFAGAVWEDKFLPITLALVTVSAWKRRRSFL